jgi:hypothetical protein
MSHDDVLLIVGAIRDLGIGLIIIIVAATVTMIASGRRR